MTVQSRRSLRVSPAASMRIAGAPSRSTSAAVRSKRSCSRGCWSRSSSRTAARDEAGSPSQAQISLWFASGSSEQKAGSLAFSLTWVFQRRAAAAVGPAP